MAYSSGLAAQLGLAAETTWGTYATPTRYLEFVSESIKGTVDRIESRGLRSNNVVLRNDRWTPGRQNVAGDLEFEVGSKGFGLLFKHALGAVATTADGAGFKHSCTIGDTLGLGLTVQVGRPDIGGTVRPFSYTGCKVSSWELSNTQNEMLMFRLTLDGQAEDTAQTLGSASYAASDEVLTYQGGAFTIAASSYTTTAFTLTGDNALKNDRFYIDGTKQKSEQLRAGLVQLGGSITSDFLDLTAYNRFVNGTTAAVAITYTGANTYDTGKNYKVVVTLPCVRFDGETPNVAGEDVLSQPLPFKVLYDGSSEPITIDYYTSDAAP